MTPSLQDVGLAVKRLQWRHHREGNKGLGAATGLSLVQWDVLRHLHRQPDASLHALAQLTFQTDQSMGELARRMTDRGLITRREGTGRAVRHQLTEEGEAAYREGADVVEGVLTASLGRLSQDELTALYGLLVKASAD